MLRKSYDEDSEFQNKLNFAKHKTNARKKLQAAKANSIATEVPKVQSHFNLAANSSSVYSNQKGNKAVGINKASVVSQQTVVYENTGKPDLKSEPS